MPNHTAEGNGTGTGDGFTPFVDAWDWLMEPQHVWVARLLSTLLLFLAVTLVARLARRGLEASARRTAQRSHLDEWRTRALISRTKPLSLSLHILLYVGAFIGLLGIWGLHTAFLSLLTAAGFAGIIIGLAAANSLSNLIAGFLIFYNHPFDIGDWVEIEGVEGIVLDVMAGATIMQTWDGEKVTFPNRVVEGARVRNMSHERKLRRRFQIGIDYSTDIEKVRNMLVDLVKKHPYVLAEPEPMAVGIQFSDNAIVLELRYWIAPLRTNALLVHTWLMQEVQRLFAREGVVIPFPQRTMVWRFQDGNAPQGEVTSRLAYDPSTDDRPFPGPAIDPPRDVSSTHHQQAWGPRLWFRRSRGEARADEVAPADPKP